MIPRTQAIQLSVLYIKGIRNKVSILVEKQTPEGSSLAGCSFWDAGWFGDRRAENQEETRGFTINLNRGFPVQLLGKFPFQTWKEASRSHSVIIQCTLGSSHLRGA